MWWDIHGFPSDGEQVHAVCHRQQAGAPVSWSLSLLGGSVGRSWVISQQRQPWPVRGEQCPPRSPVPVTAPPLAGWGEVCKHMSRSGAGEAWPERKQPWKVQPREFARSVRACTLLLVSPACGSLESPPERDK